MYAIFALVLLPFAYLDCMMHVWHWLRWTFSEAFQFDRPASYENPAALTKETIFLDPQRKKACAVSVFHSEMRLLPVALWLSVLHDACDMTNSMMHAWVLAVEVPLTSYHLFLSETSVRWLPCFHFNTRKT
jgi:hypothetical protein